jgi:hypothetical protein
VNFLFLECYIKLEKLAGALPAGSRLCCSSAFSAILAAAYFRALDSSLPTLVLILPAKALPFLPTVFWLPLDGDQQRHAPWTL